MFPKMPCNFLQIVGFTNASADATVKAYDFVTTVTATMKLLKVVLQPEGPVELNDPLVQEAALKQVSLILPLGDIVKNTNLL